MLRSLHQPLLRRASLATQRSFHASAVAPVYKKRVEEDIRYLIDSLPPPSKIYQNPDGSPRQPSDLELHKIAQLSLLASKREIGLWKWLTMSSAEAKFYSENYADLQKLLPSLENGASSEIIDKIPYEKPSGEIEWKIVRASNEEGWEKLSYYGLVPGLVLLIGVHLFKDEEGIDEWAEYELKLRALEDSDSTEDAEAKLSNVGKSLQEIRERDNLIIERIISGEYDKLTGLQLKKAPSLIGDISGELPTDA
jgi:hypothetical protein